MSDWDQIVADHGPAVFRLACRILGCGPDAEDAVQEAFLQTYRIGQAEVVEHWGAAVAPRGGPSGPGSPAAAAAPGRGVALRGGDRARHAGPPNGPSPASWPGGLRQAVAALPQQQAAVFSLRYFDDLSYEQIAAGLGLQVGHVASALHKARGKLKTMLADQTKEQVDRAEGKR